METGRLPNSVARRTVSGAEFKAMFPDYCACKFVGCNMNGFEYAVGPVVDPNPLTTNEMSRGGLYFTDVSTLYDRLGSYGTRVAILSVPSDARVFIEGHSACKADKLVVLDIVSLEEFIWGLPDDIMRRALPHLVRHYTFSPQEQARLRTLHPSIVFPSLDDA